MSAPSPREYEFSQEQNSLIGALADRMRGVGFFLVVVGVLNFLIAVVIVLTIYRARLPQKYVDAVLAKASDATRTDVNAELSKLPPDTHLWGIATTTAVNGLLYLLIGVWTQSASGSFKKIVTTQGSDIHHLMGALSSLNKMYTLVYSIIVIGLLLLLLAIGQYIFVHVSR
jgi:hypothetical protein